LIGFIAVVSLLSSKVRTKNREPAKTADYRGFTANIQKQYQAMKKGLSLAEPGPNYHEKRNNCSRNSHCSGCFPAVPYPMQANQNYQDKSALTIEKSKNAQNEE